jgi:hypothetical protein
MNSKRTAAVAVAAVVIVGGAALWWMQPSAPPAPPRATAAAPAPAASAAEAAAPVALPPAPPASPLAAAEIPGALSELLGQGAAAAFVLVDDFPRRLVATVDNLGREHAPPLLWPVAPTPGRFTTQDSGGATTVAAANAARYEPFVRLVEAVDPARAVQFYRRVYPLLATAYHDLGYPHAEFHHRLLAVVDLLLATPQPAQPPAIQLVDVKGSVPSVRPWVRYEFVDPALQSLAAGQKILLRVGPANEQRLKARLRQLRAALVAPETN